MNVLVTGGTGFIGCYVAKKLLAFNYTPILVDLYPNFGLLKKIIGATQTDHIKIEKCDITSPNNFDNILYSNNIKSIIHLAAFRNTESQKNPLGAFKLNCEGTINIFEAALKHNIKRVVYASSVAVFGPPDYYKKLGFNADSLTEEVPINPQNFYGVTKVFNEQSGYQYNKIYNLETIGIRLGIIFGFGKKAGSRTSGFNGLIENPALGKPISIPFPPSYKINMQHVEDAAETFILAINISNYIRHVYNTGSHNVTVGKIVDCVRSLIPEADITLGKEIKKQMTDSWIDKSKANDEICYQPKPFKERVKEYIATIKKSNTHLGM